MDIQTLPGGEDAYAGWFMQIEIVPILIYVASAVGLAGFLLLLGNLFNPRRPSEVKRMPYESGMDPLHDTRRRFDVRFHLMAIAFLVFDVELLFLYPWAVAIYRPRQPTGRAGETVAVQGIAPGPAEMEQAKGHVASGSATERRAFAGGAVQEAGMRGTSEAAAIVSSGRGGGVTAGSVRPAFVGGLVFVGLLVLGLVYDWKKGVFQWR